jgi:hypothetical protein
MVEVRATRQIQLCKELWQAIVLLEGVNQQCLLPVATGAADRRPGLFLTVHWPSSRDPVRAQLPDFARSDSSWRSSSSRSGDGGDCWCVSWMRVPHVPEADSSSCTTLACTRLTCQPQPAHFSSRVQSSMTPACIIDPGYLRRPNCRQLRLPASQEAPREPTRSMSHAGVAQCPHGGGNAAIVSEVVLNSCLLLLLRVLGSPARIARSASRAPCSYSLYQPFKHSWLDNPAGGWLA